jgi:SAM-dependent methyltransferase
VFDAFSYFEKLWEDHQPDLRADLGSDGKSNGRLGRSAQADFWNRRASSYDAHGNQTESREHRRLLVESLADKAGIGPDSQVLDIGCGPGKMALVFAEKAARVEALDIAPKMIALAEENAAEEKRPNVHFQALDWSEADLSALGWEKKFQLVLASKTPAVNDRAALEKMTAASNGYCCLITQVDVRNSVAEQLKPLIDWDERRARLCRSFYCAFNLLWLLGYYPEVEYFERTWIGESSLEDAELMHCRYFDSIKPLTASQKKALARKLESLSQDGLIKEVGAAKAAVMFWSVRP